MADLPDQRLFRFLDELSENNDREWFAENKARYRDEVLQPAVELVRRLEKPLVRIAPMMRVVPKAHNGSVMRIYRDTRFSKNKQPYKTNVGISLRHEANGDIHAPGLYVHFANDECFVGCGCWRPPRDSLGAIRAAIAESPAAWKKAVTSKRFRDAFALAGESLKTAPRDYPKDHPMIVDLRRIDFIGVANVKAKDMLGESGLNNILDKMKAARSLMKFLCEAVGVPY